jgi:23S rRNA (guanosine2251-2'-O)-methyltransferase
VTNNYAEKKAQLASLLTVYGRKPVLETLRDNSLSIRHVHLADSNREQGIIKEILQAAAQRNIEVRYHSRLELSRISKNGKQDQGVAADIACPEFSSWETFRDKLDAQRRPLRLLALDGITNPQNLGMIVRSACAGDIDAILWSRRGNAALGPLVIKASTGTLYRAPMVICDSLPAALEQSKALGFRVNTLAAEAEQSLFSPAAGPRNIYVLGNETDGVSAAVRALSDCALSIPMARGVESLNVAVTAGLIAYASQPDHLER